MAGFGCNPELAPTTGFTDTGTGNVQVVQAVPLVVPVMLVFAVVLGPQVLGLLHSQYHLYYISDAVLHQ